MVIDLSPFYGASSPFDRLFETLWPSMKDQNKANLILENGKAYSLEGTLQFSDVTVDPTTGSVTLRLVFPNPEGVILPGMFVKTIIKEGVNDQAILVPQQGVARDSKGNPYVLLVNAENKVALRHLKLDRSIGNQWLVSDGLAPGDRVIVTGAQMLRPGAEVKVVPVAPSQAGQQPSGQKQTPVGQKQTADSGENPEEGGR